MEVNKPTEKVVEDLHTEKELKQLHKEHKKREHDIKVQSFLDKHQKNVMGSH